MVNPDLKTKIKQEQNLQESALDCSQATISNIQANHIQQSIFNHNESDNVVPLSCYGESEESKGISIKL